MDLRRREFLATLGTAMAGLAVAAPAVQSSRNVFDNKGASSQVFRCVPKISGSLWYLPPDPSAPWSKGLPENIGDWKREIKEQRRLGFDLLWFSSVPEVLRSRPDLLHELMDLCAECKMQVILDAGMSPQWYGALNLTEEIAVCADNIGKIGERFRGHPAFHAWYVPHEVYMCWGKFAEYIDELYPRLVERCKAAAPLPVTLSPFFILDREKVFGDFQFNEPAEYEAYWGRLIRRSGFDVIMLQDSGEHFSFCTMEERHPFFAAMHGACQAGGAKLWGNVEVAEYDCPSKQAYITQYGRVHHSNAKGLPWRAVPLERLKAKLALAASYSERIVSWGYREYCRPALGEKSRSWCKEYRRYQAGLD